MDFITKLPCSKQGHDAILVVVDPLTKMGHFIPTTSNVDAPGVASLFFTYIFKHHGLPKSIVSDRDPKFTSNFWKSLFKLTGTTLNMSTAYHAQTDGQTERLNRTLEEMVRAYVNYEMDNWEELLPAVEFAYNDSAQASSKFSPFYLNYGFNPDSPLSLLAGAQACVSAAAETLLKRLSYYSAS
jgi:hypothetical protein